DRRADRIRLDSPKPRLAMLLEDVRDRVAVPRPDLPVDVDDPPTEPGLQSAGHRRLPRAHEPDERQVAMERVQCHSMRSQYARCAATKSPIASPPHFSFAATASSPATAASPTTASASTAATSERSTSAVASSPVARSTEASGFIRVGNGFIAARTNISSPVE